MLKKIFTFFVLLSIWFFQMPVLVSACVPNFRWDYTVEGNCTWPGNYTVRWNINVGTRTVTVPTWRTIWVNLAAQRVTFTSGRINFQWSASMRYTNSGGYYISMSHSSNSWFRNCPSWMRVLNMTPSGYQGSSVTWRPASGVFYCWK